MSESESNFLRSTDKKLLAGAAFVILFSLYYLLVDETLFGLLGSKDEDSNRPVVGQISDFVNDTRHKSNKSFAWSKAKQSQQVRMGDSVFTGAASRSRVDLLEGGYVDMRENTLIVFDSMSGLKVPNLKLGNFKLAVKGNMKVVIDNEVTEIKGDGSEVEIVVKEKQKPQIKITKGAPQVISKVAVVKEFVPEVPLAPEIAPEVTQAPPPPAPVELVIQPLPDQNKYLYTDQLYDFYQRSDSGLEKRKERRREIDYRVQLHWQANQKTNQLHGQLSETPNFERAVQYFSTREQGFYEAGPVYLGTNYWRLSKDKQGWTNTEWFVVESEALKNTPPKIELSDRDLYILGNRSQLKMNIVADAEIKAFVIETSRDPQFPAKATKIRWSTQAEQLFSFTETGTYYIRARGVNQQTQVTGYGPSEKLQVIKPKRAQAPALAKNQIRVFEQETVSLDWQAAPEAKSYEVELLNTRGEVVKKEKVKSSNWKWQAGSQGAYKAQVTAIDGFGRKSNQYSQAEVLVSKRPVAKQEPKKQERKIASVESTSITKNEDENVYINRNFPNSKIEIIGSGFTMYSSEQYKNSVEQPVALMLGLRVQHWFNNGPNGVDGLIRGKLAGVNTSASNASPLLTEIRYNRRLEMNWNIFSAFKKSQLTGIIGYEMYRNSSSSIFASKYDLMKLGFSVAFPLGYRWDTGGEILYGTGFDTSKKYEISGFVNYYFKRDWSAGIGYRLHLFEAGGKDSTPTGTLPYREGFGEGYSSVRWHY